MRWEDRIDNYVRETGFPKCLFIGADGRVVGTRDYGKRLPSKIRVLRGLSSRISAPCQTAALPGQKADTSSVQR